MKIKLGMFLGFLLLLPGTARLQPCAPTAGVPCATNFDFRGKVNVIGSAGSIVNNGLSTLTGGGTLTGTFAGTPTFSGIVTASAALKNTGGALTVGSASFSNPLLDITGLTGTAKTLQFSTGASRRWNIRSNTTPASGGDVGSDLEIIAFSDVNGSKGNLINATRNGSIGFNPNNQAAYNAGVFTSNLSDHSFPKGSISQNGNRVFTAMTPIGAGGVNPGIFNATQTWTGTLSGTIDGGGVVTGFGIVQPWYWSITDKVNNPPSSPGYLTAFNINHIYETGADGNRGVATLKFGKNAPSISGDLQYSDLVVTATYTSGEGGQAPDGSGNLRYKGVYKGMNLDNRASDGADWIRQLQLGEFDIALTAGLHAESIIGVNINYANNHGAESPYENGAWVVDRSPTATAGTTYALMVGTFGTQVPFVDSNPDTAIIGVGRNMFGNNAGHPMTIRMQRIVDGRYIDALTNAWETPGFKVGPGGFLDVGPAILSFDGTTGLKIAAPGVVAVSAVPVAAGDGYMAGDTIWDTQKNAWTVSTVSAGGHVTGLTLLHAAATSTCPSAASATIGGTGDTLAHPEFVRTTVTVTCATPLGIMLADTGQKLGVLGATPIARPTPTGACAGNTGCQALRDVLVNFGFIVGSSITN